MSLCEKCVTGVRHEGSPKGSVEGIDGIRTYVAKPTTTAILFLTDAFGSDSPNAQLLADGFAQNGFQVYLIDQLQGDPVPGDAFSTPGDYTKLMTWLAKHGQENTRPPLDAVIKELRKRGITQFGVLAYCFGARSAFDIAFENITKAVPVIAVAVIHPSLLEAPKDFEEFNKLGIPLLVVSCGLDVLFPDETQVTVDKILGGGSQSSTLYERLHYKDCDHGFAIRGDLSDPKIKTAKEEVFKATVEFFLKHL